MRKKKRNEMKTWVKKKEKEKKKLVIECTTNGDYKDR